MTCVDEHCLPRLRSNDPSLTNVQIRFLDEARARDLVDALRANSQVTILDILWCEVGDGGAAAIADALRANRSITRVELVYCGIGDAGAAAIAAVLANNDALTTLNLNGNQIGDAGAAAIADALVDSDTLTHLDLGCNHIGAAGAKAVASALLSNDRLEKLNLGNNRIGADGAAALAAALCERNQSGNCTALSHLILRGNNIGEVGGRALAAMMRRNRTIKYLNLRKCGLRDEAAKALANALVVNHTIERLDLSFNLIGDVGEKSLACATLLRLQYCLIGWHYDRYTRNEAPLDQALNFCRNADVCAGQLHRAIALLEETFCAVDFLSLPYPKAAIAEAPHPIPGRLAILERARPLIIKRILELTPSINYKAMPLALERIDGGCGGSGHDNGDGNRTSVDAMFVVCRKNIELLLHTQKEKKRTDKAEDRIKN